VFSGTAVNAAFSWRNQAIRRGSSNIPDSSDRDYNNLL